MSSDMLQEAYRLIRAGSKKEAARMLVPYVRASPNDADAWWLLANAFEEPDKQLRALDRVLHLRPDDIRAQKLYDKLAPPAPDLLDTPSVPIPVPPVAADVVPEPEPEPERPRQPPTL